MKTVVPFFEYDFSVYAPDETIGMCCSGRNVFSAPPPACCFASGSYTCRGTIGTPARSERAFATGAEYCRTSVVAFGAVARLACWSDAAWTAVAPLAYLIGVLIVQAASSAGSGCPSDHFVSPCSLNVHTLPPWVVFHDFAQSPTME